MTDKLIPTLPNPLRVAVCLCGHGVMAHLRRNDRDRDGNYILTRNECQAGCSCRRFSLKEFKKV